MFCNSCIYACNQAKSGPRPEIAVCQAVFSFLLVCCADEFFVGCQQNNRNKFCIVVCLRRIADQWYVLCFVLGNKAHSAPLSC